MHFAPAPAFAKATNVVLRSLFGALLPSAGQPRYDPLGPSWGNSLSAFISIEFAPFSVLLLKIWRVGAKFPIILRAYGEFAKRSVICAFQAINF